MLLANVSKYVMSWNMAQYPSHFSLISSSEWHLSVRFPSSSWPSIHNTASSGCLSYAMAIMFITQKPFFNIKTNKKQTHAKIFKMCQLRDAELTNLIWSPLRILRKMLHSTTTRIYSDAVYQSAVFTWHKINHLQLGLLRNTAKG